MKTMDIAVDYSSLEFHLMGDFVNAYLDDIYERDQMLKLVPVDEE